MLYPLNYMRNNNGTAPRTPTGISFVRTEELSAIELERQNWSSR